MIPLCFNGHILSPENVWEDGDGKPKCRTCRMEALERFHKKHPERKKQYQERHKDARKQRRKHEAFKRSEGSN